jgi:hypothetical protein
LRQSSSLLACGFAALLGLLSPSAEAFTYIVQPGDTLAGIAERFYGKLQNEKLLVVANSLDAKGGTKIVPGMRLEVPALTYVRIDKGYTWQELATRLLGGEHRSYAFAEANGSSAWLAPPTDAEVIVPYSLRFVATGEETVVGLAYRFLGDRSKAWMLDQYNQRQGKPLERGDIILLPVVDVELTEAGKQAALESTLLIGKQAGGADRAAQARVATELPKLDADVRSGRYVEAVTRGVRLQAEGELSKPQRAAINRQLLEAYVALEHLALAAEACRLWRKDDETARLDPVQLSPKLMHACEKPKK